MLSNGLMRPPESGFVKQVGSAWCSALNARVFSLDHRGWKAAPAGRYPRTWKGDPGVAYRIFHPVVG